MELYNAKGTKSTNKISTEFLYVNNFGYIKNIDVEIHLHRENGRRDYQMIYIDKGYGFFKFNNEFIKVEGGNIVIIPPNIKNDYYYPADSGTHCYWIHFTGTGTEKILSKLNLEKNIYKTGPFYEYKDIFSKMSKFCTSDDYLINSYLSSSLHMLLCLTAKKIYIPESPIHKILDEMKNLKISEYKNIDFANKCNLSEYHFIREFKKIIGKTPHKYMAEIIVSKAIELLTTTSMNVSETAYFLGFEDSLYFSRFFKKETGISPKEYIKSK